MVLETCWCLVDEAELRSAKFSWSSCCGSGERKKARDILIVDDLVSGEEMSTREYHHCAGTCCMANVSPLIWETSTHEYYQFFWHVMYGETLTL